MESVSKSGISVSLKEQVRLFFGISLGIFLFVLFFEPFGNVHQNTNEKILFYAGIGGITFFFTWMFRTVLPWLFPSFKSWEKWNISPDVMIYGLIWIFSSVAFVFYIRYVGPVIMSMYLVFKIILIALIPVIALRIKDEQQSLNSMVKALMEKNSRLQIQTSEKSEHVRPVELFTSESKSEMIKLSIDELILVRSADNYVEILYRDKEKIQQKLIRNTLKNIETQLKKYSDFIRCHRAYIINKKFVLDFKRGYTGYHLKLSEYNEVVPVSRQYLIIVKEAITAS